MNHGQMIGATDSKVAEPVDRPVHFGEVHSTLYHHLGIDPNSVTLSDLSVVLIIWSMVGNPSPNSWGNSRSFQFILINFLKYTKNSNKIAKKRYWLFKGHARERLIKFKQTNAKEGQPMITKLDNSLFLDPVMESPEGILSKSARACLYRSCSRLKKPSARVPPTSRSSWFIWPGVLPISTPLIPRTTKIREFDSIPTAAPGVRISECLPG